MEGILLSRVRSVLLRFKKEKKIIFKNNPIYDYLGYYYFTVDKYLTCVFHTAIGPKGQLELLGA